jgi:Tfp pilus assembly protein PilF
VSKLGKFHITIFFLFLIVAGCGGENNASDNSAVPSGATDPSALTKSAVKKQEIGAFEEAIELLDQALQIDPQFVPAYYRKGLVYEEWDQRQEAIQAYKKVLELESSHEGARLGLGSVHSKSNRNDLAILEYQKVAALRPNDPELLFKIALEYWYIQKLPESAEHYRKVIEIDADHMQAHLNLASVYERMKDWENAIDEIEIARRLGKKNNDEQAIAIAERKLHFIKGRMNLTAKDMNRKTQPPFE